MKKPQRQRILRPTPNAPKLIVPPGGFGAIMSDVPWRTETWSRKPGNRAPKYPTMPLEDICRMRVGQRIAAKNCWLFFWTTGTHLEQAFEVLKAWDFRYSSTAFIWAKLRPSEGGLFMDLKSFNIGLGKTTRKNVEICLLGRRGNPRRLRMDVLELLISQRRRHSEKPPESYERIEKFCIGPYLDLFSRQNRNNWTAWGNEAGKFNGVNA